MRTSIVVQNLKCGGCAKTITTKLSEIEQVSDVIVDVENARVSFVHKGLEAALLVKARLKTLGYPTIADKNTVGNKAMSFVSCATGKMSKG